MNDPLLAAFQRKNNNLPLNLRNFGRSPFQGMPQGIQSQLGNQLNPSQTNSVPLTNYNFAGNANNQNNNNFVNPYSNYNNFNNNFAAFNQIQQQYKIPNLDLLNNNNNNNMNMNFLQNSGYAPQNQLSNKLSNSQLNSNIIKPMEFKFKEKENLSDNSNV